MLFVGYGEKGLMANVQELWVAIIEGIIIILMRQVHGWGRRYSFAVAGWIGYLITQSKLVSIGKLPVEYSTVYTGIGLVGLISIMVASTNVRIRLGPFRDIFRNITDLGNLLVIASPIVYALVV